jgi:CBS domain-containing protein
MNERIGIWIDHRRAVIVSTSADRATATTKTLESEVGRHARYSGQTGYPTPDGTCLAEDDPQDVLDAMSGHKLRRIPVIDINRRIVGIIAQADVATRAN